MKTAQKNNNAKTQTSIESLNIKNVEKNRTATPREVALNLWMKAQRQLLNDLKESNEFGEDQEAVCTFVAELIAQYRSHVPQLKRNVVVQVVVSGGEDF